jgi:hypothetical protein
MKKYITLLSLLGLLTTTKGQVHMQFKNTTNKPLVINVGLWEKWDTIPANGVGAWRKVPAISTNQWMRVIFSPNQFQEINNNTSIKDTTYTKGNFSFIISYDAVKNKYRAKLKTL